MNEPKPIASLGPTLLARKGGARPAMRAQVQPFTSFERNPIDDLGWNDDGEDEPGERIEAKVLALTPAAIPPAPAKQRDGTRDGGRRAAFTLRVDAERHLKLRLACTIRNLSAQQIVTEALDRLLADIPEIASLAAQVKRA
ncbi:MAG: hypothetical protein P0Y56_13695 [Candidatus Andeanibacterium colombiense]|uniref:Uncharacterized protein n=1 Tax=Candidatus Andeanibacterium colombiense TaxID=3121345 RepID=A0AAJ5X509_9SPHN|nr:MAG: hypothetical protein P0Y56_13695 [Sphingomonadaceae bacterium]